MTPKSQKPDVDRNETGKKKNIQTYIIFIHRMITVKNGSMTDKQTHNNMDVNIWMNVFTDG